MAAVGEEEEVVKKGKRRNDDDEIQKEKKKGKDVALKDIYYSVKSPGSFSTWQKLQKEMKKEGYQVTKSEVLKFLLSQPTYGVHRRRNEKFARRQVYRGQKAWNVAVSDLLDMSKFYRENGGLKWICLIQDQFSNYMYLFGIKDKGKKSMTECFDRFFDILPERFTCTKLISDRGNEYLSIKQHLLSKYHVALWHTSMGLKSFQAEKSVVGIKARLYRAMYHGNTLNWSQYLNDVQKNLNASESPALFGYSPDSIIGNKEIEKIVARKFAIKYVNHESKYNLKPKFQEGMLVRYALKRDVFFKGYRPNYSETVHRIEQVRWYTSPPTYIISSIKNRVFYGSELLLVTDDGDKDQRIYVVEKSRRRSDGRKLRSGKQSSEGSLEFLVKSIKDKNYSKWVSSAVLDKLRQDGLILRDLVLRDPFVR